MNQDGSKKRLKAYLTSVKKVSVIGAGTFGSLWATLLATKFRVDIWSLNSKFKAYPYIKQKYKVTDVDFEAIFKNKVIFICSSINSIEEVASKMVPHIKAGTLVLDCCSIKHYPLTVLTRTLPEVVNILGTHPMFGPDSCKAGVKGLPIVLSPCRSSEDELKIWEDIFTSLELKVVVMDSLEHDKEAALTQGLTHLVGRVCSGLVNQGKESQIATKNYKNFCNMVNSVCSDSMDLFLAMQKLNPCMEEVREAFSRSLNQLSSIIMNSNRQAKR